MADHEDEISEATKKYREERRQLKIDTTEFMAEGLEKLYHKVRREFGWDLYEFIGLLPTAVEVLKHEIEEEDD